MDIRKQDIFNKNLKSKEIDLKEYYEVIKKRLWIIVLITIFTTAAGYFYSNLNNNNVPLYQTSTRIIVGANDDYMKTLMVMIKDSTIMEKVNDELGLNKSPEEIAGQIEISRIDNSRVINIAVTDTDPSMAAKIANSTASVFKSQIVSILNFNNVELLSPAKENSFPINQPKNNLTKIAFALGVILGIGLVFLLDSLDETIKKEYEIEEILEVPVIGVISNMNRKKLLGEKKKYKPIEVRGEVVDIQQKASSIL